MAFKRKDLEVGKRYSFVDADNVFEVLAVYEDYQWIRWVDDSDVESVFFELSELKKITKL
jgi:hypothetical protein